MLPISTILFDNTQTNTDRYLLINKTANISCKTKRGVYIYEDQIQNVFQNVKYFVNQNS